MAAEVEIPDRLRSRIVSQVADVLPRLTTLPGQLRTVAGFAPAKRARLGETAIWAALERDDSFRTHAATQLAAEPADHDEPAVLAWLRRDPGWEDVVGAAARRLAADEEVEPSSVQLTAAWQQVEELRREVVALRAAHREQLARAREEQTVLRRRLGEARAALRRVEAEHETTRARLESSVAGAEAAAARAEAEARRLRSQLESSAADVAASRRDVRAERDATTLRARYLLDALVESATGLRRELGLPPVEGAPADAVEAELKGTDAASVTTAPMGPAVLEQLVSLPAARLVVDGYNVTKQAWPTATLEAQRSRLVGALGPLVSRTGVETTVVFDAAAATTRAAIPAPRGVKVVFSPPGVIADDVIRRLVSVEPRGRIVVVVTDDQEVVRDVRREGARPVPASALLGLLER